MQQQHTLPANQEPSKNPKRTWQEPELVNLNVRGGAVQSYQEASTYDSGHVS